MTRAVAVAAGGWLNRRQRQRLWLRWCWWQLGRRGRWRSFTARRAGLGPRVVLAEARRSLRQPILVVAWR